jgi:hypothetical protein
MKELLAGSEIIAWKKRRYENNSKLGLCETDFENVDILECCLFFTPHF